VEGKIENGERGEKAGKNGEKCASWVLKRQKEKMQEIKSTAFSRGKGKKKLQFRGRKGSLSIKG